DSCTTSLESISLPVFWCLCSLLCVSQIKMSQVKQVGLLAAGCQPWNKDVCAASEDRFAYCATLAIYVYQLDHRYNEFKLRAIMSEHKKTITAISWCPHNPEVFASASADNLLIIWNVAEQKIVARLDNTKDSQVGVLRIWNVSRSTPLDNFKLKKTGFHALHVLNSPPAKKCNSISPTKSHYTSSTSEAVPPPTLSQNQAFSLPPGHAVCCFMDGGVGLYDMGAKKWDFLRDLGHVETIFDCKFKPDDPNLLATASFDGTIKVWDINTLTAVYTSPGNEGVVYSLSWAPGDLNCIAGATSRNGAFIWDVKKGKMITRFNEHGNHGIFCIAWSHKDSKRIATCSGDGFCIIRTIDGRVLHKYKHPAAVFGCDWSQNNKDMIATGCEDKNVRVYYLATSSDQPLKVFTGHLAKVFHVRWSPLREGILCSGSDDGTVRIWDYTQDACINVLSGHTAPVRGLMWNTEVPYLLTSGSWDYTIKVWDTRDGTCLDTCYDHGADVYGLTCHPSRPFTMASCSRDSTVRLWSLTPLIAPLLVNVLADHSWDDIIGNTDRAMVPGATPLLCGKVSRDIKQELDKLSSEVRVKKLRWFSECFSPPGGSHNLWDLVSVINGQDDSLLPQSYGKGIMHMKHLVRFKTSEAQELTIVKMSKFGGGIGAPSKEERLRDAAEIHLRLGQIQRYCELMVELGEWDKALSVAPGVSIKYWKKLMQRRADQLMQEENHDVIPYCIATGDVRKLVNFFTARGQLNEALLVAQGACEGNIHVPQTACNLCCSRLLQCVCKELAEWYFQDGRAVLAACCHLAVDNTELAMASLIRGNELELAVCVGLVLGESANQATHYVLELLARKYMTTPTWDLAADLLQMIPDNEVLLAKLCAFYPGSSSEIDQIHEKCGLPSLEECQALAESAVSEGDIFNAVKYYLMSPEPEAALLVGIAHVKEQLSDSDWTVDSVHPILDLLGYIRTDRLILAKFTEARSELLILSGYIGALLAIRRQYSSIVPALYEYTSQLMKRREVSVPLQIEQLSVELEAWMACTHSRGPDEAPYTPPSEAQKAEHAHLLDRLQEEPLRGLEGPDYVTGSNLPSHSDVQVSCFTGLRIQGPVFFLEDGKSAISLNDALMWAKVNPFSPLGTGVRLNPF
uniref:Gem-associated protein 5 TPR domain-containing protein n=1 Tax=Oncorhynchus tshawytscha TaxID=74940 RepID=A0A8C8HDV6_ONCTS